MRTNREFSAKVSNAKEERAAKCVNEFLSPGSCRKGKDACRFSHKISDDHRKDRTMRKSMEDKYHWLTGRRINLPTLQQSPFSRNDAMTEPNQNNISPGHYQESLPSQFAPTSPSLNQSFPPDLYHSYYPEQSHEAPQPLMQQPAQMQVINLLQNLLAQMINVNSSQFTSI
jgi:hypothetical protein